MKARHVCESLIQKHSNLTQDEYKTQYRKSINSTPLTKVGIPHAKVAHHHQAIALHGRVRMQVLVELAYENVKRLLGKRFVTQT